MFTGIVTAVGRISKVERLGGTSAHGVRVSVETPAGWLAGAGLGDSISVNGACMTVTTLDGESSDRFAFEASAESLDKTVGLAEPGPVNLEQALRAGDRLGGHIVSGHIDGTGRVLTFEPQGESWLLRILAPRSLGKYLAYKGSITVNGVSLTVNTVTDGADGSTIEINLIPHTVENTALNALVAGGRVNLEIDLIARYVERMLSERLPESRSGASA